MMNCKIHCGAVLMVTVLLFPAVATGQMPERLCRRRNQEYRKNVLPVLAAWHMAHFAVCPLSP